MLCRESEAAGGTADVERDAKLGKDFLSVLEHPPPADDLSAVLVADENVLGDVEVGKEEGLLIDCRDTEALCLCGAADCHGFAGEKDLAAIYQNPAFLQSESLDTIAPVLATGNGGADGKVPIKRAAAGKPAAAKKAAKKKVAKKKAAKKKKR